MERLIRFLETHTSLEICRRDGWFYAVRPGDGLLHEERSEDNGLHEEGAADGKSAGRIAFRADMDALPVDENLDLPYASAVPGVSHKCGHDGHSAALCGLALELDQTGCENTVYLIFQPAEEIGAGGGRCASLIKEQGIEEVYAFHNLGGYPEGTIVYRRGLTQPASEGLEIRLTGKQSHASAPEEGNNPAEAIADIVTGLKRAAAGTGNRMVLCTVTGIQVGTGDFGISPGEGTLRVTLRAEYEEDMKRMERAVCASAAEQARRYGLRAEFQTYDYFPETKNSGQGIDRVITAANELNLPVHEMSELWRASEDFGYYLKECTGAMVYIGNGERWPALHTDEYDFNDRVLPVAVDLFKKMAGR